MVKDILFHGDIVPFIVNKNEIDIQTIYERIAALNLTPSDTLRINIHTLGGCTVTAFAMYNYFRRLVNDGVVSKIITRIDGYCASSGVIILLAGDERVGNEFAEPFVHCAWTYVESGNASELIKQTEDLKRTDNKISALYAKVTSITVEQALQYMNADTWIGVSECMALGFYTSLENVEGVEVTRNIFNSLRQSRQTINSKKIQNMSKPKGLLNKMIALVQGHQNKIVKDAAGVDVDFYELEDGATPQVGDKALVDGQPAGEYNGGVITMADGKIYTFVGEEITAIEDAPEPIDNGADDKDAEINRLKNELEAAQALNVTQTGAYNKLKAKYNKVNSEKSEAFGMLEKISSIKDAHVVSVLNKIENDEPLEGDDEPLEGDDEDIDENGFPNKPVARVNISAKPKDKAKKTADDGESTGDLIKGMMLNTFKANRK